MMRDDVRMRGFRRRAPVEAVLGLIDARVACMRDESVGLLEAAGRVLARDAVAAVDVPGFRRAAMDGYAVVAEQTFGATPDDPRSLRVVGESLPAQPADARVEEDTCVRIMTGAPMPEGADAVVPVEQTESAAGHAANTLRLAGGLSRSPFFAQLLCDVLGRPLEVAPTPEASALGAAPAWPTPS